MGIGAGITPNPTMLVLGMTISFLFFSLGLILVSLLELKRFGGGILTILLFVAGGVIFGWVRIVSVLVIVPIVLVALSVTVVGGQIISEMIKYRLNR